MVKEYVPYNGPIVTRKNATKLNLEFYFTGKPCKHGHFSERKTKTRACLECTKEKNKNYYWENKEACIQANREWHQANLEHRKNYDINRRANNLEKLRAQSLSWNRLNPERMKIINERYRINNKEAIKEKRKNEPKEEKEKRRAKIKDRYWANREHFLNQNKIWRTLNPEKNRMRSTKYRAAKLKAEGYHTAEEVLKIFELQNGKCVYCKTSLKKGYHKDHIQPLSKGGSDWISNIQLTCPGCNMKKRDKDPIFFAQTLGKLL